MYGYGDQNNFGNNFGQNQRPINNFGNVPPQMQDERIWVANQQVAESYLVAANNFIRLWDSSQPRFYEKSSDCTGRPMAMKVFEYQEVTAMPEPQAIDYVSTKDFEEFKNQVNDFINNYAIKEVKKNAKQSNAVNADA